MGLFIPVNGLTIVEMVMELNYGQMVLDMKDNGKMIKRIVKVNFNMLMETSMRRVGQR